jgi:hypothetical protein
MTYENDPLFMLLNIDADGSDDEPDFNSDDNFDDGFQPLDFDSSQNDDDDIDQLLAQLGL